jgi:hypothetical protein
MHELIRHEIGRKSNEQNSGDETTEKITHVSDDLEQRY